MMQPAKGALLSVLSALILASPSAHGENEDQRLIEAQELLERSKGLRQSGQYSAAVAPAERARTLRTEALGPKHPAVLDTFEVIFTALFLSGEYAQAHAIAEEAVRLAEELFGHDDPALADPLLNLGLVCDQIGEVAQAEELDRRALTLLRGDPNPRPTTTATALNNFGTLYVDQRKYTEAEIMYEKALTLREQALGRDHPDVAQTLSNLGDLYRRTNRFVQAAEVHQRALAIFKRQFGDRHPFVAVAENNLASVYHVLGQPTRAEPLYLHSLKLREELLGQKHGAISTILGNLSLIYMAQGRRDEAVATWERAATIEEHVLRQFTTEPEIASHLKKKRPEAWMHISGLRLSPDDARLRRLVLSVALLRKGRALDVGAGAARAILRSLERKEDQDRYARLLSLRSRLSHLYLTSSTDVAGHREEAQRIEAEIAQIEAVLTQTSVPFRILQAPLEPSELIARVARSLPQDGALVEVLVTRDFPFVRVGQPRLGQHRYIALVLRPSERISIVDLGERDALDTAVHQFRDTMRRPSSNPLAVAQKLYELVFKPILAKAPEVRRWYLSLDGELQLLPFAAMHDGKDYLIATHQFSYLTSGRDLLRPPAQGVRTQPVTLLADPDFDRSLPGPPQAVTAVRAPSGETQRELADLLRDVAPLPNARDEAKTIARQFRGARLLLGAAATESALLGVLAPRVLHIATHGLYLADDPRAMGPTSKPDGRGRVSVWVGPAQPTPEASVPLNPMLRSTLILAGVSKLVEHPLVLTNGEEQDGLVTALEVSGMNLWGTQLVVLSACDTGRGETQHLGQGVYGLRRAFFVAGAETLVTSLWQVSDASTKELMVSYYRQLLAGHGRGKAMHKAAQSLRKRHPHPYYWAPFIVLGRDAPL